MPFWRRFQEYVFAQLQLLENGTGDEPANTLEEIVLLHRYEMFYAAKSTVTVEMIDDEDEEHHQLHASVPAAPVDSRYNRCVKKLTNEALFGAIDANSDERIEEAEFKKFFSSAEKLLEVKEEVKKEETAEGEVKEEPQQDGLAKFFSAGDKTSLDDAELSRVFSALDEEDEAFLSKTVFLRLVRHYMKVAKDAVLTPELDMKDGKTIRRLEPTEVIEILEGPIKEESTGCYRVKVKVMKDAADGWTTIAGNQGSVFLQDGGDIFKVVKETILTDSMDLGDGKTDGKTKPRKLKEGELVQVREWPTKQEGSGLTRMMCRAKSDGRVGWATTVGNTGITFIEVA